MKGLAGSGPPQLDGKDRDIGRLRYSDDEVLEAAAILGGQTWIKQKATKAAFLENAAQYGTLHLAMHALVDDQNPLNSSLIFSRSSDSTDFMLRAGDLYSLQLEADLAVLSACNTGFGTLQRGEGVRSLARAFTYAGCSRLLATLWEASDHSTKDILLSFYEQAKEDPDEPIDLLLQRAKRKYLEEAPPTFTLPNCWAHLLILGDAMPLQKVAARPFSLYSLIAAGLFLILLAGFLYRKLI